MGKTRDPSGWFSSWDLAVLRFNKGHTCQVSYGEWNRGQRMVSLAKVSGGHCTYMDLYREGVYHARVDYDHEADMLVEAPRWMYQRLLPEQGVVE